MTEIPDAYALYTQRRREAATVNREIVFDALSVAGITLVTVTFDGEGDSGQIEAMEAYTGGEARKVPDVEVQVHSARWEKDGTARESVPLAEAIEQLCYDLLWNEQEGWEINDGSFGEFTFDVASRRIALDFNARFVDSVLHRYTF